MLLYIHVPFCKSRCRYCAFHSSVLKTPEIPSWFTACLCRELALWGKRLPVSGKRITSVFFGGGTPSLMQAEDIARCLNAADAAFGLNADAEVSLEGNPESLMRKGYAQALARAGVNRLSMGIQSMDNGELRMLGRTHTAADAAQAYRLAREAGFTNISVDLMWGLPGQGTQGWLSTLEQVAKLGPEHVSAYELTPEEHTLLRHDLQKGKLVLPDEDEEERMYNEGLTFLAEQGYQQYEISNFARSGNICRHNMGYWKSLDYLGIGPSAVSCVGTSRWTDALSFARWQNDVETGSVGHAPEQIAPLTKLLETVMLRMRTAEGLAFSEYRELCGNSFLVEHGNFLANLEQRGLMAHDTNRAWLTPKGMLVSNAILAEFFRRIEEGQECPA